MFCDHFVTQFIIAKSYNFIIFLCVHRERTTVASVGNPDGDGYGSDQHGKNGNRLVRTIGDERTKVEVSTTIFKDFCTFL